MAKRPKHLRKKVKEPAQIEKPSRTSRSGRTMIGPPIVKRLSSFITDLQEGKISLKSTLPVIF
ncbi:MAG: hypothetical protein K8F91_07295, partial [Candidatus Obscuribacterales bacterium]|nr:hypothetical protein [Candidatus Obscuribacterales bacterium]